MASEHSANPDPQASVTIESPTALQKSDLLKLYELSLQEYRFQVLLNWDRSKQMLVVDGVLLGAAATLYKLQPGQTPPFIVGVIFLLATTTSVLGFFGVRSGHVYYKAARALKTKYEQHLGLPLLGLSLETTPGMRQAHRPEEAPVSWPRRFAEGAGKVKVHLQLLFVFAAVLSLAAAVYVFWADPTVAAATAKHQ